MAALNGHRKLIVTIIVATICLTILVAVAGKAFTGGTFTDVGRDAMIAIISALIGFAASYANQTKA